MGLPPVDKSLLLQEPGLDGEPRYRMLETAREFGLEQVAASGEDEAIREWHAQWHLALAVAVAPLVHLAGEPARLAASCRAWQSACRLRLVRSAR